jgi:flagellar biosynthesis/type III secretory pathway protein FliH
MTKVRTKTKSRIKLKTKKFTSASHRTPISGEAQIGISSIHNKAVDLEPGNSLHIAKPFKLQYNAGYKKGWKTGYAKGYEEGFNRIYGSDD